MVKRLMILTLALNVSPTGIARSGACNRFTMPLKVLAVLLVLFCCLMKAVGIVDQ